MNYEPLPELTNIEQLGEFALIDRLTKDLVIYNKSTQKGVGDDAAVLQFGEEYLVVTKDLLVEGVHFDVAYTPLTHLGYKSVAVNLSDIYAMNGVPTQIIIGLAVSSKYSVEAIEDIYEGINAACKKYKVDLVGGDTTAIPSGLTISITAIGRVEKERITYRRGAKVGDLICVSGSLGGAYCGLLVLQRETVAFMGNSATQPDLTPYTFVIERQLIPEPRRDITLQLLERDIIPTSMIDVSDGLASEILHLCKNSNKGAVVYEEHLPIDSRMASVAHEFEIDPATCALSGGEDYELLFTVSQGDYEKVKDMENISIIGHITQVGKGANLITSSGQKVKLTSMGWDGLKLKRT